MKVCALLVLQLACSSDRAVPEVEQDSSLADTGASRTDAAMPDCGCLGPGYQTLVIRDRSNVPGGMVLGSPGADICGIEVRCGDRVLVGTQAVLHFGEYYRDEPPGDEFLDPEQALDTGEDCAIPPPEGAQPAYVSLGFSGGLVVLFANAGPCGLAGCQITVREADLNDPQPRENPDRWDIAVCLEEGPCLQTSAGEDILDGTATLDCCTCEPW